MNNNTKILIATGGTGGHVFPGCNLAKHLLKKKFEVILTTDKRGYKFFDSFKSLNIFILSSSQIVRRNILTVFFSFFLITYSVLRALIFLYSHKPKIVFGMGGYSSFPICIAAKILKIKLIIYENNLIVGKANKYLLPYCEKILVSFNETEGISDKYKNKVFLIGNIIKEEIINFQINKKDDDNKSKYFNILILGGSQAAKIFAETLPNIFKQCKDNGIRLKIYQQCLIEQNERLKSFYQTEKIDYEVFNFENDLTIYLSKVNLAITRSGSSMLAELTNARIPFIAVPLPTSADNHQFKNALHYQNKTSSFLLEEKDLKHKLLSLIQSIHNNLYLLDTIRDNQRQFSDKNVYNNIDDVLKKIINEKN